MTGYHDRMNESGRTVLITGVSRGLGKGLAERFLKNGDTVIGTSTSGKADWSHDRMTVMQLDLADPESIARCAAAVADSGRRIDILINNAGTSVEEECEEPAINPEYLRKVLEVNVTGTADFTERIIPLMNEGGHIINISSRAGTLSDDSVYTLNYPTYRISKAALNMVTRILARRLRGKLIVSSVHPGWVQTDMGGEEADLTPAEAAEFIFALVRPDLETGQFWYKGEKFPW